ncbi:MAG TPA: hypothetical protein DHV28_14365 [Ignavibacteriales bacterium]|nr:hypothetical protein [Ignavibacteriales bacterium]
MIKYIISIFLSFAFIISCASKEEKLQNLKDYVQKISSELKFEDGFDIIKVIGERRSRARSYYLNDKLVFINETVSIGDRGTSSIKYFFKDGNLINYSEKTILMKDDSLNIESKTLINLELYLDDKSILESEYLVAGVQKPFADTEVDRIIDHSRVLKELSDKNKPANK